jgi:hypothetical protein
MLGAPALRRAYGSSNRFSLWAHILQAIPYRAPNLYA